MARDDNSSFLTQANTRRHEAALAAARHAIDHLRREGRPVNYAAVAHAAGVSRTWLYRQDQIRDLISQLRDHEPPATAQRASTDSLPQRLDPPPGEHNTPKTRPPDPDDTRHGPSRNCGGDMSTPRKRPSTRHNPRTASDNRRYERWQRVTVMSLQRYRTNIS